jgi:hypothetical protein
MVIICGPWEFGVSFDWAVVFGGKSLRYTPQDIGIVDVVELSW